MPSQEKRGQDGAGPSTNKRLRSQEQNNNILDDNVENSNFTENAEESSSKCGILQWITVKNFMCHDHFNFEFSPHINFVQGRNGSGKSAILTAVVIGLGGVTRHTNRGNSLKELVKHGKQVATIEIGIMNSGSSAFKPELYGKSVVVERKITITTGGGYKMKSWNGTVVSTKKDELLRMLEHFNLQVDNPVTILNQDMSRSFFNTTEPKMLFKLFLKATQMQQMKDDYAHLEKTIHSAMKIIECRKECLPDLEKEVEDQRIHYQFSLSLREKGKKLKDLRHELAWAKIIQNETKKAEAEKALEKCEKSRTVNKNKIDDLLSALERENELRERNAEQLKEASNHLKEISNELREMNSKMKAVKNDYKDKQCQFNVAEKRVRATAAEISTLKAALERDNNRAQSQWAAERAEWQSKIDSAESEAKDLLASTKTENTHHQNIQNTLDIEISNKAHVDVEEKAVRRQLNGFERELRGLQSQKGSQLTVYGQWVPQMLNKIDAAHSKGMFIKKPVGPMGAFIKVKDNTWAHVAEHVLGRRITSFCVDNQRDEKVLRNLMKEVNFDQQGMPIVTVTRFRDKVHDVSRFEVVSSDYPSLWSILDISDTVVANTIIDLMQVECILLIPTAQEAGRLLKDRTMVPKNCKTAYTLNRDQYYPDPNYRVYSGRGSQRARFLQVSLEDKIREIIRNKEECVERLDALAQRMQESHREIKKLQEEINTSKAKSQQYKRRLDNLRMTLVDLRNQETPPPPDIAQLEDDVRQQEESLEKAKAVMEKIRKSCQESKSGYTEMSGNLLSLRQREKNAYKEVEKCKREVDESSTSTSRMRIENLRKTEQELLKKVENCKKAVEEATNTLTDSLTAAEAFNLGARIETKRSVKELECQYTSLQARLNRERASSGDPITIAEKYMATKQRYKQVTEDLNKHISLLKKLRESLNIRENKYCRLHRWLAVIVKYFFKEHLSLRKLNGSISICLDEQTLDIHVEKPGAIKESPAKDQKIRKRKSGAHHELVMMSGGERSFATVAFIIALWHAIVSPVRILDEFDVFMDVIARNRAMQMMISAANPCIQYIFLTPLSLDKSKLRNCVFFRMPDPVRNEDESHEEV